MERQPAAELGTFWLPNLLTTARTLCVLLAKVPEQAAPLLCRSLPMPVPVLWHASTAVWPAAWQTGWGSGAGWCPAGFLSALLASVGLLQELNWQEARLLETGGEQPGEVGAQI